MKYHFDAVTATIASGWIFDDADEVTGVEAWESGKLVGRTDIWFPRPDVSAVHKTAPDQCGFSLRFRFDSERTNIEFKATTRSGHVRSIASREVRRPDFRSIAQSLATDFNHKTPFPLPIAKILRGAEGARFNRPLSEQDQMAAIEVITTLAAPEYACELPDLMDYIRFLREASAHMRMVARFFPEINQLGTPGAHDYFCKTNSWDQMISVVHHLYVLKSYGLTGAFAEFGCFKGFSSSMLSLPCARLGIPMMIFDSFEGLPPSNDPTYKAGEFRGTLEEVKRNVEIFGAITNVTFHPGFFSESMKETTLPQLMQIWMDVDLYSSAKDLAPAIRKLDARGAVFSHECEERMFKDGQIVELPRSPGNVVPAITDEFKSLGSELSGRFIAGNTGVFYRKGVGIPVLRSECLLRLCQFALT